MYLQLPHKLTKSKLKDQTTFSILQQQSRLSEVRMSESMLMIATGWLKLKYPTRQNAISRQPCEIFTPKFLDLYGRDPATILKLKKNIFVLSKVMAI